MIDADARVDPAARIADDVTIGPWTIIGADVEIGAGTRVGPHVVIRGPTRIGRDNRIYQFASIGDDPQDKKYAGESDSRLVIGDRNTIREFSTLNRGTAQGGGVTRIGDDNWVMAYSHIAHDCIVGNHTVFANSASLAGHVVVEDYAILGGFSLVHQFCRIGAHSFTAMGSVVVKDLPPFVMASGNSAHACGINREGLVRRGFNSETIQRLRKAYKIVYKDGLTVKQAIHALREFDADCPEVSLLADFLENSSRGILR